MKRHGNDNEDKQPDKRPRLHQVMLHTTSTSYTKIIIAKYNLTLQQAAQAPPGLVALPSALARLLLSFLPGRAIPSLLGVSHTARRLCACLHKLNLSWCEKLDDVRFVSSLVKLRTLYLSCCRRLSDATPLSSLTSLTSLNLRLCYQLSDVSPLSSLTSMTSLDLSECGQLSDVSPLSSLTSLTSLNLNYCYQLSDVSPLSSLTSLTSLDMSGCSQLSDLSPLSFLNSLTHLDLRACLELSDVSTIVPHLFDQLVPGLLCSAERCVIFVDPHFLDQLKSA